MKLRYCLYLTSAPDFTDIANLEELILEGCKNLVKVHPSIGMLKKLPVLNMRDCTCLKSFPSNLEMDSLQILILSGCLKMEKLPEDLGRIKSLTELHIDRTSITELPLFVQQERNNFTILPGSLSQLSHLRTLKLDGYKELEVLPEIPHTLQYLDARDCTSLCSITGSSKDPIRINTYRCLINCPKLFTSLAIDSQLLMSETQCLDSCITSQGSTNRLSSFLRYAGIHNNICEFFRFPGSFIKRMDIIYDGNSIPEWFTNKSIGNHVKVELPSDWCFNKFRGYGTCVVFKRKKAFSTLKGYSVKNFDGSSFGRFFPYNHREYFEGKPIRINESYMIWLYYMWNTRKWKEANNFVTFYFKDDVDEG
ncbi:NB-ARC domains-containing protein [Tanacetum coccineum]